MVEIQGDFPATLVGQAAVKPKSLGDDTSTRDQQKHAHVNSRETVTTCVSASTTQRHVTIGGQRLLGANRKHGIEMFLRMHPYSYRGMQRAQSPSSARWDEMISMGARDDSKQKKQGHAKDFATYISHRNVPHDWRCRCVGRLCVFVIKIDLNCLVYIAYPQLKHVV